MGSIKNFLNKYVIGIVKNIDWVNIKAGTYVRWILAFVACINSILNMLGLNVLDVDENQLYVVISNILTVAIMLVNTYKNNSTSSIAIKYDEQMRAEKTAPSSSATDIASK